MENINVPPMTPPEKLIEMRKAQKEKTFHSIKSLKKKENKPYKLQGMDGVYAGAEFPVDKGIIIGRNPGEANIIYPAGTAGISRLHCSLREDNNGQLIIKDLGSSQGTFFADGTKLQPNVAYRINRGECFYLASKRETYKVI
jgi:hypothetical protein